MPLMTIVSTRLSSGRKPKPYPKRSASAVTPAARPMRNSTAPATPKKSIGLRPKRSWNQTETRSNSPTGMRRQLNFDTPALRG
jgi:hypothetical protein